ncbi:sensor histidine kinase [Amycolatopsis thermophila]|uniref:histidine kinase n=1 Tax=Amycolatopsis thermophila TaxID=206084 RepID=A0ABU0EV58_9PSEU|nr:sensor histidine kinase [Amycolatopsis thermophila]MDQ0379029.1 signal transduction histidine kinase [Amycolatopsis thermophila]
MAVVAMLVPAVGAAAVLVWLWWGGTAWSWIAPVLWAGIGTLALARPVCRMVRALVARWTGTVIPGGYRQAEPVVRMSTGYWWNGRSYEKSRRDAQQDQRLWLWFTDPATWRDLRFTAIAPVTVGVVACVPPTGFAAAVLGFARSMPLVGVLGLVVAVATAPYAWRPVEPVATRFLRASPAMALAERVDELTAQRADATVAQAAEIRRIERDLHDGAQARLVALGMSLATAEKLMDADPERAKALLRDARAGAATSLTELRELVRGINPPVLTERGLVDAVRAFALDCPLEVAVRAGGVPRLDPPIESAVYFAIAELVTNAIKHAHASRVDVTMAKEDGGLVAEVTDDGRGGAAERDGGGLAGVRHRLAVFDGTCEITSPSGGPTRVRMMVPCA